MPVICSSQPASTGRFLGLLADAISVDAPESLLHEPGLADIRGSIRTFVAAHRNGQPIQDSLQPWVGRHAATAGLAAFAGCLDEWLRLLAACLETHGPFGLRRMSHQLTALFLRHSVSLPLIMRTVYQIAGEGDEEPRAELYPFEHPLRNWLIEAEREGHVPRFFEVLAGLTSDANLDWTLEDICASQSQRAQEIIGTIVCGLRLGYPLTRIFTDLGQTDHDRLQSLSAAFQKQSSLSLALFESNVVTHLGAKLIHGAEQAGNIEATLLNICKRMNAGVLFAVDDDTNRALDLVIEQSDSPVSVQPRYEQGLDAWIDGISIRGRMAYAVLCIESALSAWGVERSDRLQNAVDKLWDFTTSAALDVWDREIQKAIPGVAGFDDEQRVESEWRETAGYFGYAELPDYQQEALGWMLACAMEIGIGNLYSGFSSWCTAAPLAGVINALRLSGLALPPHARVSLCRVQEGDGWGAKHPREYFL